MVSTPHFIQEFNSAILATVAGLFVGAIFKFINKPSDKRKQDFTEHLELRKELREELDAVKEELHQLQKELDEWKEKYYHQLELTNQLRLSMLQLTDELDEYKRISGIFPAEGERKNNGWPSQDEYLK
jgi:uncharacterized membrane-anchored protein YhcB (DUF1043 family)